MDDRRDYYIKEKLQEDKLISKKADDVFNNFLKEEPKMGKVRTFTKAKKWLAAVASLAIVVTSAQVYASTQGYGNIFFLIKYLVTGEKVTDNKDEILSDKDITISYEPIKLTENIRMQIRKLQIKDNQAKLIISLFETTPDNDSEIVPLKYKVFNSSNEEICNQESSRTDTGYNDYTDELILKNFKNSDTVIHLEIYKANSEKITRLTMNLNERTITVDGEKEALEKVSEIELKKFLGYAESIRFAKNKGNEETKIDLAMSMLRMLKIKEPVSVNSGNLVYSVKDVNEVLENIGLSKVADTFTSGEFFKRHTENGVEYFEIVTPKELPMPYTCIDIPSISYCGGIYTVTFTYVDIYEAETFENGVDNANIYQNTITLSLNDSSSFVKFKLVSAEEPVLIKDAQTSEEGKVEIPETNEGANQGDNQTKPEENNKPNTGNENNTNNGNSGNTDNNVSNERVDNYATSMSWTEHWAPGLKFQYPANFEVREAQDVNEQGAFLRKVGGILKGIDPETKEIIETDFNICSYQPEHIENLTSESYAEKAVLDAGGKVTGNAGIGYITKSGLQWYISMYEDETFVYHMYTNYDENGWGRKLLIYYSKTDSLNYKVTNVLNWIMGSTILTSH